MNAAVQQDIKFIPLTQLRRSPRNVRKTGGSAIKDLVASIAAHGLLQNLQVLPAADGTFEVVAGARRLAALGELAKDERIARDFMVPCLVLPESTASETSLAENTVREAMHPADQFLAFSRLVDDGMSPADIAARFGVPELTVHQRMKLAHVAPSLIEIYRQNGMSLEQLMAFTVSNDKPAQERFWSKAQQWDKDPARIRDALTKGEIDASKDPRARLVGVTAYELAGGVVRRDLFGGDNAGYLKDAALLDRLAREHLERIGQKIRAEGWKWVEARLKFEDEHKFKRVHGKPIKPTPEETKEISRLQAELETLDSEDSEVPWSPEVSARCDVIRDRLDELVDKVEFTDAEKAAAGVVVTTTFHGDLRIVRGLVRQADQAAARKVDPTAKTSKSKGKAEKPKDMSDALAHRLSAQRVAAVRAELIRKPRIALVAIVHALLLDALWPSDYERHSALLVRGDAKTADLRSSDESITGAPAWIAVDKAAKEWRQFFSTAGITKPKLWGWLLESEKIETLHELLALGVTLHLGGVQQGANPGFGVGGASVKAAHALGDALGLDMTRWWKPTVASYLGAVSKAKVLEALEEAGLKADAVRLADGKTGPVAAEAATLLSKTTWLPKLLRSSATPVPQATPAGAPAVKKARKKTVTPKRAASTKAKAKPAAKKATKGAKKK